MPCDDFLGHVTSYQLHLTQIIDIGPGGEALRSIGTSGRSTSLFPGYDVQCNTIWAGDDFTEENGATRIVIEHQLEDGLRFTLEDSIPAEMTKGSVLFYSGSVSGGGANDSDANRRAINITYNVASSVRRKIIPVGATRAGGHVPEPLQRLMGYQMGAYALGYIDDLRDPINVLTESNRTRCRSPANPRTPGRRWAPTAVAQHA